MKFSFSIIVVFLSQNILLGQIEICDNGVDDDNDNLIDFNDDDCFCQIVDAKSLIPNPSFEDQNCCPDDRSQLYCADSWIQASAPTTDFIHTCDWLGWDQFPPPRPFPDGEGIMGFRDGRVRSTNNPEPYWKEYAGACLLSPLLKDSSYRFQFDLGFVNEERSPPIDITFFGTSSCDYLPFGGGDIDFGCPTNSPDWIQLGTTRVSAATSSSWVNTYIEVVPEEDIYAIAIGPSCRPIDTPVSLYYFFDNLFLTDLNFFNFKIKEINHPCSREFVLSVPFNENFEYQWYLNGVSLIDEKFSKLRNNYGEGNYQVRIVDKLDCRISANYNYTLPIQSELQQVSICQGDTYRFGDLMLTAEGTYIDTLKTAFDCDSIITLNLTVIGEKYDTIERTILNGEVFEISGYNFEDKGEYPLELESSQGCDSLLLLILDHFIVYIPNVFSPNLTSINRTFEPLSANDIIVSYQMEIFDRWGNLIHTGAEWTGQNHVSGLYVYMININFENGQTKKFYGSVTLLN